MPYIEPTPLTATALKELRRATTITIGSHIDAEGYVHAANIVVIRETSKEVHRYHLDPVPAHAAYSGTLKGTCCDRHKGGVIFTSLRNYNAESIPTTLNTVLACLKQGDKLYIEWREAGNTSPVMEEHGMIMDQLVLRVHRPRKGGKKDQILIFDLDHVITTSDSSARWFHTK
jgi:hypothetical protein